MTDFAEYVRRDLRLALLKALSKQPGYRANEVILQYEAKSVGIERSRDVIRGELRYLTEIFAVKIEEAGSVMVATLRRRGLDHVNGLAELEGVNKPSPEA